MQGTAGMAFAAAAALALMACTASIAASEPMLMAQAEPEANSDISPLVLEMHGWLDDCQPMADLQHGEHRIAVELEDGSSLYVLPCTGSGYNLAYVAYHDYGGEISQLQFVDYSDERSWFSTPYLFDAEWDPESSTLKSFGQGRSLGDCGSASEWRYGDSGFRLQRLFYQGECDGSVPPGEFPLFFEAKPSVCRPGESCE
ncbi:MAG: DUF1176 domain-containing protein [Rhizobiaceae bacterium]|nr:DUF1176 domain-containing protein [Rhizobiaceae bacterium]MCV0406998.1 DUF1176 domain-containing protein [Rhizobiaceae bacterium]